MPVLVGVLIRGLLWVLGTFVGRLILNLGIGFVAYKGVGTLLSTVQSDVLTHMGQLSTSLGQIAVATNVPQAISILFAAITMRYSLAATSKLTFNPVKASS